MKTIIEIPETLLFEAEQLSGLHSTDVVVFALKSYIKLLQKNKDREFGEQLSSFDFWENPKEDIYNDLIEAE